MKISISIPVFNSTSETLIVETDSNKKVNPSEFSLTDKKIYQKFISFTGEFELFELDNYTEEIFIYRVCVSHTSGVKYIDYNELSTSERIIVKDFVELIKNKY